MEHQPDSVARACLRSLCEKALSAQLSFNELMAAFPKGSPSDPYYSIFYEDLVDGVEHVPGTLLGKVDQNAWRESEMFLALLLHERLLSVDSGTEELLRTYERVRSQGPLTLGHIQRLADVATEEHRSAPSDIADAP